MFFVYFCVWIDQATTVSFSVNSTQSDIWLHSSISDSNATKNTIALSLLCVWTLFWHCLLIGIQQRSPRFKKSTIFLFQQTHIVQLISYGFAIAFHFYAFVIKKAYHINNQNDTELYFYNEIKGLRKSATQSS